MTSRSRRRAKKKEASSVLFPYRFAVDLRRVVEVDKKRFGTLPPSPMVHHAGTTTHYVTELYESHFAVSPRELPALLRTLADRYQRTWCSPGDDAVVVIGTRINLEGS
jgi:hypothetical protein